jgi:hypothetical protein
MSGPGQLAALAAAVLALTFVCAAATTSGAATGCRLEAGKGPDVSNQQEINRPAGDASLVAQSVTPASRGNLQTATTSSPDGSNVIVQTIDGDRNVQAVRQSGRNNVAVQSQTGECNRQSIRQSGNGNVAVQLQSGRGLSSALNQRGDEK